MEEHPPEQEERGQGLRLLLAMLVVVALGFLAHRGALKNEFVDWDDDINLYANPNLINSEIRWALPWVEPYQGMWIPVTYTTWAAIAAATREEVRLGDYRLEPAPYHAANLALHLASSALLVLILARWLPDERRSRRVLAALAGALLFALHPIQVEVVHWATALKDALSTFLALAAVACVPRAPKRLHAGMPAAWILFALALAAKPGVVVLPVVWLLLVTARDGWPRAVAWVHFAMLFVLGIAAAVIGRVAQPATGSSEGSSIVERLHVSLDSLGFYLGQILVPRGFCPDYGRKPGWVVEQGLATPEVIGGAALVVVLVALLALRKWRALLVFLVLPAAVGPVIGVLEFTHQKFSTVTDRYAYLAMLAPVYALALVVAKPRLGRVWPLLLPLLAFLGHRAGVVGESWRTGRDMWENVLVVNPRSSTAWSNLGFQHDRAGDKATAIEFYEKAAGLDPTNALALNNIGNVHFRAGDLAEARTAYERARRANPKDLNAKNNLGAVYRSLGQPGQAEALFREVVEINPNFSPAHHNLGLIAIDRSDFAAARLHLDEALRVDPGFAAARRSLALVQAALSESADDDVEARENLALALGAELGAAEFELEWANVLEQSGRGIVRARAARVRAYELGYREPGFLVALGRGLSGTGEVELTERVLRDAIEAAPEALDPRLELAALLEQRGEWDEFRELMAAAVADFPFAAAPWHNLAVYHRHVGDLDKARAAVATALRLRPDFGPSQRLAAELEPNQSAR